MINTITTTLNITNNKVAPQVLGAWLKSVPGNASLEFVISRGYEDRMSYSPDRVSGIKATWTQEFEV